MKLYILFLLCIVLCVKNIKTYQCRKQEHTEKLHYPEKSEFTVIQIICTNVTQQTIFNHSYENEDYYPQDLYIGQDSNVPLLHPNSSLSRFAGIRKLLLSHLNIEVISPGVFDSFQTLQELDLNYNSLRQISNGTFNNLENLKMLNLSYNFIEVIEKDSFSNLFNLHTLYLSFNRLSRICNGTFNNLKNLKLLELFQNSIEVIEEDNFSGLFHLEYLHLNNNEINELHDNLFKNLTTLVSLDISHNKIRELPNITFAHFVNLTYLNIGFNHIKSVDFAKFPKLKKFYLSFNKINLIQNWEKLNAETVLMDLDQITDFEIPENVIELNLFMNKITNIINKFSDNSEPLIQKLSLASNQISRIDPSSFKKLKNLAVLYLDFNEITIIPENTFQDCSLLRELTLAFNKIEIIEPNAFKGIHPVAIVDITGNNLKVLNSNVFSEHVSKITLRLDHYVNCTVSETLVNKVNCDYHCLDCKD